MKTARPFLTHEPEHVRCKGRTMHCDVCHAEQTVAPGRIGEVLAIVRAFFAEHAHCSPRPVPQA